MKRILLLLYFISLTYHLWGQGDADKSLGAASMVSFYNLTYRAYVSPQISLSWVNHSFSAGPVLVIASNTGTGVGSIPKFSGLILQYSYYPNFESKRFSLYLSGNITVQRLKDKWLANAYDSKLGNYTDIRYQNVEWLFENHIGYGLKIRIGQRFFITKGLGAGFYLSDLKGKPLDTPILLTNNFDYRGYGNFGFAWNIQLGLFVEI